MPELKLKPVKEQTDPRHTWMKDDNENRQIFILENLSDLSGCLLRGGRPVPSVLTAL